MVQKEKEKDITNQADTDSKLLEQEATDSDKKFKGTKKRKKTIKKQKVKDSRCANFNGTNQLQNH
eukprot:Pgem_evm1s6405